LKGRRSRNGIWDVIQLVWSPWGSVSAHWIFGNRIRASGSIISVYLSSHSYLG
jgi:hypothetical protein